MSEVAQLAQVRPARPNLPVAWYFDPGVFELEKRLLFDAGPNYVGHELMVPNVGDYHTLADTDHAKVLVRNEAGGAHIESLFETELPYLAGAAPAPHFQL